MLDSNSEPVIRMKRIEKLFLTERGFQEIRELGIIGKLVYCLSNSNLEEIENHFVYINAIFSPASNSIIKVDVKEKSNIITIDINTLKKVNTEQATATILHEIGRALNPDKKNMEGEYAADDYAIERGYKEKIVSSLKYFKENMPLEFDNDSTNKRISRIEEMI